MTPRHSLPRPLPQGGRSRYFHVNLAPAAVASDPNTTSNTLALPKFAWTTNAMATLATSGPKALIAGRLCIVQVKRCCGALQTRCRGFPQTAPRSRRSRPRTPPSRSAAKHGHVLCAQRHNVVPHARQLKQAFANNPKSVQCEPAHGNVGNLESQRCPRTRRRQGDDPVLFGRKQRGKGGQRADSPSAEY